MAFLVSQDFTLSKSNLKITRLLTEIIICGIQGRNEKLTEYCNK